MNATFLKLLRKISTKHKSAKYTIEKYNYHFFSDKLKTTLLHYSAECGNEKITQYLLEKGCDVNAQNIWGKTPLMMAVTKDEEAIVKLLLSARAAIDILDNDKKSALHMVFAQHNNASISILKSFLFIVQSQFSTNEGLAKHLIDSGCHAYQAIFLKNASVIEYMLIHGFSVDSRRPADNQTLLHLAVSLGDLETVKLLLEYGADAKALDNRGATPLYYLYLDNVHSDDRLSILKILLNLDVSLVQSTLDDISSVLEGGDREAIRLILESNFDLTIVSNGGTPLLHYLARNTNPGVVEELEFYVNQLDVNVTDRRGWTPLFGAVDVSNVQMVKFLLENGAKANSVIFETRLTPIYVAYMRAHLKTSLVSHCEQCFELLLRYNADPQFNAGTDAKPMTIFNLTITNQSRNRKATIAHLAMLEKLGTPVIEIALAGIEQDPPLKKYFERCRRVLERKITSSVMVLDLLAGSKPKMARCMNNKLVRKLDRLRFKNKVKLAYLYYSNTVEKRYREVRTYQQASTAIRKIFRDHVDEGHLITHAIMKYLDVRSLRALSQYSQLYR